MCDPLTRTSVCWVCHWPPASHPVSILLSILWKPKRSKLEPWLWYGLIELELTNVKANLGELMKCWKNPGSKCLCGSKDKRTPFYMNVFGLNRFNKLCYDSLFVHSSLIGWFLNRQKQSEYLHRDLFAWNDFFSPVILYTLTVSHLDVLFEVIHHIGATGVFQLFSWFSWFVVFKYFMVSVLNVKHVMNRFNFNDISEFNFHFSDCLKYSAMLYLTGCSSLRLLNCYSIRETIRSFQISW